MAKFFEEEDEDGAVAVADAEDTDSDETEGEDEESEEEEETPKAKTKPGKAKAAPSDEEEEAEEDEAPKKKVAGTKAGKVKDKVKVIDKKKPNGKSHRGTGKGVKAKAPAKHKIVRGRRTGDRPFLDGSIIGRAFKLSEKGLKLNKLKQFVEDQKALPWVISFLRKGERNGFTWRVEENDGFFKISGLKAPKSAKPAAKAA